VPGLSTKGETAAAGNCSLDTPSGVCYYIHTTLPHSLNTEAEMRCFIFSVGLLLSLATPATPQVVVNEIMSDPDAVSDSKGEWIELYNSSDSTIQLKGLIIRDGGRDWHVIDPDNDLLIAPGSFAVLGRSADSTENGGYMPDYVYSNFQLSNSDDEVVLAGSGETVIDSVAYGPGWPLERGASLELISPDSDNSDPSSWGSAEAIFGLGDRGTPGKWNSISGLGVENNREKPTAVTMSMSVSPYPNPASGGVKLSVHVSDPDCCGDYELGIYNVRGKLVRKISSCCLRNGENILIWEGYTSSGQMAPAGAYLLRLKSGSDTATGKIVLLR